MLVRVCDELARVIWPCFADGFVGREAAERLQPTSEVVGGDEVGEMLAKQIMRLVIVALDGRFLDGAVHAFDLAVGTWVARFGQPMFDVEIGAGRFEGVAAER